MADRVMAKTERNLQILSDYETGKFTTTDLVTKYQISVTRIYEIVNHYKNKQGGSYEPQPKKRKGRK